MQRESMEFDVVIVGAGPSGLAAAIRLKQLKAALRVCVVEKGAEVGAHILSGAVVDPKALNELLPDWKALECTPVQQDKFYFLTENHKLRLPIPPPLQNHDNYIVSLSNLVRWLGKQAEQLGVEIFPGFAATEVLDDEKGAVCGITTGDFGVDKSGEKTASYQAGVELRANKTLFAEGCRGSLTKTLMQRFQLQGSSPQTYGLGVKELWEVPLEKHQPGLVMHTVGWPLDTATYGGSFIYHFGQNLVAIGIVVGLDYPNPTLSPFHELQNLKTHCLVSKMLEGGKRINYGARALNEGGLQAIPKLEFPGGMLIGATAGFMNVPRIKGSHTAMKSGMLAAEALVEGNSFQEKLKQSWVWEELYRARNIRPAFKKGLWTGMAYAAIDAYVLRGRAPWTFKHSQQGDHQSLSENYKKIEYPKADGKLTFDKTSSLYLSGTNHLENQPCHLKLKDPAVAINISLKKYGGPEQYYCPAGVYEFINDKLQINAQNCVHCKTCDIKDPAQNIDWVPPEGGGGPRYTNM